MSNEIRCYGCGAIIQNEDEKRIGYVPKSDIGEGVLCQRCFKLRHYHQLSETNMTKDDYFKVLQTIGDKDCLVIYIVDLFDFQGSLIQGMVRHVGGNDIYVLANKRDVLPKSLNDTRLEHWIRRQFKKEGIKPVNVKITSALKKYNFDEIYDEIDYYRKGRDVYVVGVTNVGKSTFINALLKHYANVNDKYLITVSEFPGTTLDLISIPFDEETYLYDSPGIMNDYSMVQYVNSEDLKSIVPRSEIKPMTYQLNPQQTLYFSGLARVDYLSGGRNSVTCYTSKNLEIHRTKRENADGLYNRHKTFKMEVKGIDDINQMQKHDFTIKEKCEIYIAGLGFIRMHKEGGRIRVYAPKGVLVMKREALI